MVFNATMNPQLMPLEVNPTTGEPFLRLQDHPGIIITPPRWDDGPQFVPYLNDPLVFEWLQGTPFPYTEADAETWLDFVVPPSNETLEELERAKDQPEPIVVNHCPVSIIRKVYQDGSDTFVGAVEISRCTHLGEIIECEEDPGRYTVDMERKEKNERVNAERTVGDPDIIWDFGDYLASAYHGQGIMTDAVNTIMKQWAIPRLNARRILATTFAGNIGSQRVFEKNGFKHILTLKDHTEVRGSRKTLEVYKWTM